MKGRRVDRWHACLLRRRFSLRRWQLASWGTFDISGNTLKRLGNWLRIISWERFLVLRGTRACRWIRLRMWMPMSRWFKLRFPRPIRFKGRRSTLRKDVPFTWIWWTLLPRLLGLILYWAIFISLLMTEILGTLCWLLMWAIRWIRLLLLGLRWPAQGSGFGGGLWHRFEIGGGTIQVYSYDDPIGRQFIDFFSISNGDEV